MNDNKILQFNIIVYPGETLLDILKSEKMTQKELAKKIGVSEKHISNIINGKARITVKIAVKLKEIFSTSARFWLNLQTSYDLQKFNLIKKNYEIQNKNNKRKYLFDKTSNGDAEKRDV